MNKYATGIKDFATLADKKTEAIEAKNAADADGGAGACDLPQVAEGLPSLEELRKAVSILSLALRRVDPVSLSALVATEVGDAIAGEEAGGDAEDTGAIHKLMTFGTMMISAATFYMSIMEGV